MITVENFYSSYQIHHFRTKAMLLKKALDNPDFLKVDEVQFADLGLKDEDLVRSLKLEMRSNLFHCIETFFTLYFCLQPDADGRVNDAALFENINKKKFYHEQIRGLAKAGIEGLNTLESTVLFGDQPTTLGKYLFYFGVKDKGFKPGLEQAMLSIKKAMVGLAGEFNDIAEYNAYKHSLRSVPVFTDLYLVDPQTFEQRLRIDASDSMTYLKDLTDKGYTFSTKVFDTLRDFKMTMLCSNLIYLLINYRNISLNKKNAPLQILIAYLGEKEVDDCLKPNVEFGGFNQTLRISEEGYE